MLPPGYTVLSQTIGGQFTRPTCCSRQSYLVHLIHTHIRTHTHTHTGNRGNLDSKGFLDRGSYGAFVCYMRRGPEDHGPAIAEIVVLGKGAS